MANLLNREKRRRKGSSRKGNENVNAENQAENSRYDDQNVAIHAHKRAGGVDNTSRRLADGQDRNNGHFSKKDSSKSLNGKPFKNKRSSPDKREGRSDARHSANAGNTTFVGHGDGDKKNHEFNREKNSFQDIVAPEQLRNMRAPVQPVPAASFVENHDNQQNRQSKNRRGNKRLQNQRLYAALDLGTNNCRLLIALPQEKGRFRVIDGFSKIVRLGEGLAHTGKLSDEAMDRAVEALKVCATKLGNHNVRLKRLIATEACRQADNGDEFLERVLKETGLKLEVINRETEARLAAEGCGALIDKKADAGVLFDIGGGSSELILVNRRGGRKRVADQIVAWTSLPVGVVTLAERYGGKLVTREVFKSMVSEVRQMLEEFPGRHDLGRLWKHGRVHLLGTSGTVTTLAGIHLKLTRYDRRLVDGLWLSDKEIDAVLESLLGMNYQQRAASPCIGKERADLVMAGCAILEAIRITWPARRLRVADRGLREGILTQLMDRDGAWVRPKKGRWPRKRGNAVKNNKTAGGQNE